jgi:hypothetical protein
LIRYLGRRSFVRISRKIETISVRSFHSCDWIRKVEFESSSQVRCIGEGAFEKCSSLSSICLPRSTESLCHSCFRKCRNLREVLFEPGSTLTRIEPGSFTGCSFLGSISVPTSVREKHGVDLSGASELEIRWYC